jgi:hypothetical protein
VLAVLWYYFRLGWDASQIANELKIKPPMVRQWLARTICERKNRWPYPNPIHGCFHGPTSEQAQLIKHWQEIYGMGERQCNALLGLDVPDPDHHRRKKNRVTPEQIAFVVELRDVHHMRWRDVNELTGLDGNARYFYLKGGGANVRKREARPRCPECGRPAITSVVPCLAHQIKGTSTVKRWPL